jgi:crossover junction endodeoxyribonuclease RuvC
MTWVSVGLDVSLSCTGWAVLTDTTPTLGVALTRPSHPLHRRLEDILDRMREVARVAMGQQRGPGRIPVGIETAFVGRNASTTAKLAMAQGAALMAFPSSTFIVHHLAPKEWRKAVLGSGGIDKFDGARLIARMLKCEYNPPADQWEAAGIALAAARKT